MTPINLVYEDELSGIVMRKMLEHFTTKYLVSYSYSRGGFGYIKNSIKSFNEAAVYTPYFVLTDLDKNVCPSALINDWLVERKNDNLLFRVAIREVESWLLADREGFSTYTGVSTANIPLSPENEIDPKRKLIAIVKKSRKRTLREDIVPISPFASIGPNYNARLADYVQNYWSVDRARLNSNSFDKAMIRLQEFEAKTST